MVIIKHSSGPKVAREQTFLMKDLRVNRLELWAKGLDSSIPASARLENVSGDASFRRYFRFPDASVPRVFVDAPPEHEDNPSFARISAAMIEAGLNVPVVFAADFDQGFMMISDLGDEVCRSLALLTQSQDELCDGLVTDSHQLVQLIRHPGQMFTHDDDHSSVS